MIILKELSVIIKAPKTWHSFWLAQAYCSYSLKVTLEWANNYSGRQCVQEIVMAGSAVGTESTEIVFGVHRVSDISQLTELAFSEAPMVSNS